MHRRSRLESNWRDLAVFVLMRPGDYQLKDMVDIDLDLFMRIVVVGRRC